MSDQQTKVLNVIKSEFTGKFTIGDVAVILGVVPPANLLGTFTALEEAGEITRDFPNYTYQVVS